MLQGKTIYLLSPVQAHSEKLKDKYLKVSIEFISFLAASSPKAIHL